MSATNYLENIQNLQKNLIDFLDADLESDESFTNLRNIFDTQKIREDKSNLLTFLDIVNNIFNNHHRSPFFISKVERILNYIKESIKQHLTQTEIFTIFTNNKRILLYFIKENLITIDEQNARSLSKINPIYFYPEIQCIEKVHHSIKSIGDFKLPENFEELRQKGENENRICELIRNDSIDDFIVYVNKNGISLHSAIKYSYYETNSFLEDEYYNDCDDYYNDYDDDYYNKSRPNDKKIITLIDYAAFFGSIQIFNYLRVNNVKLTQSTFLCSIHGNNPELIVLLEEIKNKQMQNTNNSSRGGHYSPRGGHYSSRGGHYSPRGGYYQNNNEEEEFLGNDDYFLNNFDDSYDDNNNYNHENNEEDHDDTDDAYLSSYDSILIEAIKCYHNDIVNYIILNDDCEYVNIFETALKYHNFEFINATKIDHKSLNLFCKYNYIQLVSILSSDFDFSSYHYDGKTPLFLAVESGNIEIIKILLSNDTIDVNYLNNVFLIYRFNIIQNKFVCFNNIQNKFIFLMEFKICLF